jgi:hypothetical protein
MNHQTVDVRDDGIVHRLMKGYGKFIVIKICLLVIALFLSFMLFFVESGKRKKFLKKLNGYLSIPFKFDFDGSKIIVYEPNYNGK